MCPQGEVVYQRMNKILKIIISGIGNRALPKDSLGSNWNGWVDLISKMRGFHLVAAHDVDRGALTRVAERGYLKSHQLYDSLEKMLKNVECDAILVCNPAQFHARTIKTALEHGLHVLVEKPFVSDGKEGKALIKEAKKNKLVIAVVQNWRCKDIGQLLREVIRNNKIGKVGHIFFRYVRNRENPSYPPYIFAEKHPLLYAMGIHHLDLLRYILDDDFVSVCGHSFKPFWSLYESDTGVNLFLKSNKGAFIVYSGTISSMNNAILQESLLIEGDKGSLVNESQWLEPPLFFYPKGKKERINLSRGVKNTAIPAQYNIADLRILENFYLAVTAGINPVCEASDALKSILAVEASCHACRTGKVVYLR